MYTDFGFLDKRNQGITFNDQRLTFGMTFNTNCP